MTRGEHLRNLALLGTSAIALAILPHALSVYLRSFALFTMMYVVLALAWNIVSGFTGYTSFGHVAFYGIGAYASAILTADYGWHWLPTLGVGAVLAAAVGAVIGYPVLRLKGPYFAIAMLGTAEGTRVIATVWDSLTHGGLGINATLYKLAAFVLSAVFPAVAGGIQAYKVLYIDPPSVFFVQITIAMALMAMLGGKGTVIGPILGAVLLYTAQELTWVNFPTAHLIAYGLFIVLVARFMPRGLVGFAIDRGWVRKGMVH